MTHYFRKKLFFLLDNLHASLALDAYFSEMVAPSDFNKESSQIDKNYGLKYNDDTDSWTMESSKSFSTIGDVSILSRTYKGTPGLYEILFFLKPKTYTPFDGKPYRDIVQKTRVYRNNYIPTGKIVAHAPFKYGHFMKATVSSRHGLHSLLKYNE
ncbi:hypothetical protein ABEB36_013625 [Hypothenemus hampei]|uniref:DUF8207 domain-containing protein n=1 Tax=Hypothenemus hampei TaxID=57062 RepID=A0ABD1E4R7_HYPHA